MDQLYRAVKLHEGDQDLLAELSSDHFEVLKLASQDLSEKECASRLNIKQGTFKSRLHRARVVLTTLRIKQANQL